MGPFMVPPWAVQRSPWAWRSKRIPATKAIRQSTTRRMMRNILARFDRQVAAPIFPPGLFKLRRLAGLFGPTDTEITHQNPIFRDIQIGIQAVRIKDRDPADTQAMGAGGEPELGDGPDNRIA